MTLHGMIIFSICLLVFVVLLVLAWRKGKKVDLLEENLKQWPKRKEPS